MRATFLCNLYAVIRPAFAATAPRSAVAELEVVRRLRTFSVKQKLLVAGVSLVFALAAYAAWHHYSEAPVREELRRAENLRFVGEDFPADGGSVVFRFLLPTEQPFMVWLLHHNPSMGGNASSQEIFYESATLPRHRIARHSEAERLLVAAVAAANVATPSPTTSAKHPSSEERLKWLVSRIEDRQITW